MGESTELVDLIFEKDQPESVDFEIAFTALVASATLSSLGPETSHPTILKVSALGLLALTLVRRMGVIGPFADHGAILNWTVRPVEMLTIVCVLQISTTILSSITSLTPGIHVTSLVSFVAVLVFIVLHELVLGGYRVWWGAAFFTKGLAVQNGREETDNPIQKQMLAVLSGLYYEVAYFVLHEPEVIPDEDVEKWNTLREFVETMEGGNRRHPGPVRMIFGSGVLLIIGYGALSLVLSFTGFPLIGGLLLLMAIMAIRHLVGFWYLAYGSQTFSRFLQGNTHHLATMGAYGSVSYWLFFYF